MSSVSITSLSEIGSIILLTCVISLSSKHLKTCNIASTSLICDKNWFPSPSPLLAPLTKPAISTNWIWVGIIFFDSAIFANLISLSSGTITFPTFGSIVQNG